DIERVIDEIGERSTEAQRDLLANKEAQREVAERFERNMRLYDSGAIASEEQLAAANRMLADEQRRLARERDRLLAIIEDTAKRQREIGNLPEQIGLILDDSLPVQERKALLQAYIARVEV